LQYCASVYTPSEVYKVFVNPFMYNCVRILYTVLTDYIRFVKTAESTEMSYAEFTKRVDLSMIN